MKISFFFFTLFVFNMFSFAQSVDNSLLDETEKLLNEVESNSLNIFYPEEYSTALSHFENAEDLLNELGNSAEINNELKSALYSLSGVSEDPENLNEIFHGVILRRNLALQSGADKYAGDIWNESENALNEAIASVKNGDAENLQLLSQQLSGNYDKAKSAGDRASKLVNDWKPLQEADSSFANLLSPEEYSAGMEKYGDALDLISEGEDESTINSAIHQAGMSFNNASLNAERYLQVNSDVLDYRSEAKKAGAEKYAADEWMEADDLLKQSGEYFEDGNVEKSSQLATEAVSAYALAKQIADKGRFLADAEEQINIAVDSGAEKYAPNTLAESLRLFNKASAEIESGDFTPESVSHYADNSEALARKAQYISVIAERIEAGDESFEDFALNWWNTMDSNTSKTAPAQQPAAPTVTAVEKKSPDDESYYDRFSLSDKFEDIPFTNNTLVFESDNEILIRMYGLFAEPISEELNFDDKNRLKNLVAALEKYPKSQITVAVHTSQVDTKAFNKALSEKRAENIKSYILRNSDLSEALINAVGYGEERPLVGFNDSDSIYKNKRVEIIINK
ncbi:MAG: OmpA family protein [Chlorobi bacterium]|nr:OmpA family protein [Chlorobiota bacterium]